jgi:hypothetical protein
MRFESEAGGGTSEWAGFWEPDEFARFMAAVVAELDRRGSPYQVVGDRVHLGEGRPVLGLRTLAQLCRQLDQPAWPELVADHLRLLDRDTGATRAELADLDRARPLLKVRLYPESMLRQRAGTRPPPMLARRLAPGLLAVLAWDLPDAVQVVPRDHALAWGLGEEELFGLGYANVIDQDRPHVQTSRYDPGFELTTLSGESFFTTTHALWLDRYLAVPPASGALVGVPHRSGVLAHPVRDYSVIHAVRLMLVSLDIMYREGPGSLSPLLYWWRAGTLTELPAKIDGGEISFRPPEEFVEVLNGLGPPPG